MGFFSKVFSKEECVICGAEVGALKKRKLSDGVMCKDCEKKLSPFFDDRKESSTAAIKAQLEDRELNRTRLAVFKASKSFGENGVILIDDTTQSFLCVADTSEGLFGSAKKVTSADEVADKNPDVISKFLVTDVDVDIVETRREEKQTVNGEQVSYSPKQFTFMYNFYLVIQVNHAYINTIRIPLTASAIQIRNEGERLRNSLGDKFKQWLLDAPQLDKQASAIYDDESLLSALMHSKYEMPEYSYGFKCTTRNWDEIKRYEYFLQMGAAIKQALTVEAQ